PRPPANGAHHGNSQPRLGWLLPFPGARESVPSRPSAPFQSSGKPGWRGSGVASCKPLALKGSRWSAVALLDDQDAPRYWPGGKPNLIVLLNQKVGAPTSVGVSDLCALGTSACARRSRGPEQKAVRREFASALRTDARQRCR